MLTTTTYPNHLERFRYSASMSGKAIGISILLMVIVLLLGSNEAFAQFNLTKYPNNPVFQGQPGTWYAYISWSFVLYNPDSSRYEMWFTAGAQFGFPYTIGYALSSDGISWNVHSANPVLTPTPASWDSYTVLAPYVLRENGQYKMWYSGSTADFMLQRIGYATSSDGISWTKHPTPVLEPGTGIWESASVAYPCIMPYSNGYKMWYGGFSADASQSGIGYAISPDGISWQKDTVNNPVLLAGASGEWDHLVFGPRVLYIDSIYHMFYTGENNLFQSDAVGWATSPDGLVWTKYPSNPVLQPTAGQWDLSRTQLGSVLMEADTLLKMYYAGTNGSNWDIGLATSPNLIDALLSGRHTIPIKFALAQNYPNPFNPSTVISWQLAVSSEVLLQVIDLLGQEIRTLVKEWQLAGEHQVVWDGLDAEGDLVASGVYLYRLQAGDFVETRKMLLIR